MVNQHRKGVDFADLVGTFLIRSGFGVQPEFEVEVGWNSKRKHKFDWGNRDTLVECKAYDWTASNNSPSAKLSIANESILYFLAAPSGIRKMLFMSATSKVGKRNPATLAETYVRRFGHLIPNDVEVYEFNLSDLSVKCILQSSFVEPLIV